MITVKVDDANRILMDIRRLGPERRISVRGSRKKCGHDHKNLHWLHPSSTLFWSPLPVPPQVVTAVRGSRNKCGHDHKKLALVVAVIASREAAWRSSSDRLDCCVGFASAQ